MPFARKQDPNTGIDEYTFSPTSGTSITGTDDAGNSLSYLAGAVHVWLNGVKMNGLTATDGTTISGFPTLVSGDKVAVMAINPMNIADAYTKTAADAKYALLGANSDITSLSGLTTPLSEAQGGTGATSAPTGTNPNLLINGASTVGQRGDVTGWGATSNEYGAVDRFSIISAGSASARWTSSQETGGGVTGEANWHKVLNTTADASPGATEGQAVYQKIETANMQQLIASDGSLAATVLAMDVIVHADGASSLSFPITASLNVRTQVSVGSAHYYLGDVTVTAADTWERVTAVIPANASAAFDRAMNSDSLWAGIALYGGSSVQSTADAWSSGTNYLQSSTADNLADATNNYLGITLVKLEQSTAATSFVHESYGETLAKCLRYYERLDSEGTYRDWGISAIQHSTYGETDLRFAWKRTNPTVSFSAVTNVRHLYKGGGTNCTTFAVWYITHDSANPRWTVSSGLTAGDASLIQTFQNHTVTYMEIDAEL